MINEQGGIDGRKINFISRDDGYSPPKTVEQVRKLVEQDQVLFLFNTLGTPPNLAIRDYPTRTKCRSCSSAPAPTSGTIRSTIPGPWAGSPATAPKRASTPRYILKNLPDAKIAVLYQNDDFGKDYLTACATGSATRPTT